MQNPLGKSVSYSATYDPKLLFRIERSQSRGPAVNQSAFQGFDRWNCYEVCWLNPNGCPVVALLSFDVPATSQYLVESKSLKLYLHSLNKSVFENEADFLSLITRDLQTLLESDCRFTIDRSSFTLPTVIPNPPGNCIDAYPLPASELSLRADGALISETLHSHLLRSLCPVTAQPDWGTVIVSYQGRKISEQSLLAYIVSYRDAVGFHESCCEKIFHDLLAHCQPDALFVWCAYTRRGGIDINPVRYTVGFENAVKVTRLARQ